MSINNNNGGSPRRDESNNKSALGTFPVAVAIKVENLSKLIKNLEEACANDKESGLLMYLNRDDIKLSDSNGVLRVIITLD